MSRGEVLFVKGESGQSELEDENNVLDDSQLIEAYDYAVSKALRDEVAKRFAEATNTQKHDQANKKKSKEDPPKSKKKTKNDWAAGMHCRAIYPQDKHEYEAIITQILNDTECVVTFLGYENSEILSLKSLKQSHGKRERIKQIHQALSENIEQPLGDMTDNTNTDSVRTGDTSSTKKKIKTKKSQKHSKQSLPMMYPLPPMPNIMNFQSKMRDPRSFPDAPIMTPPLLFPQDDAEDQAISSMLISWYMSGYYAGLYQGIKRAKKNQRHD